MFFHFNTPLFDDFSLTDFQGKIKPSVHVVIHFILY